MNFGSFEISRISQQFELKVSHFLNVFLRLLLICKNYSYYDQLLHCRSTVQNFKNLILIFIVEAIPLSKWSNSFDHQNKSNFLNHAQFHENQSWVLNFYTGRFDLLRQAYIIKVVQFFYAILSFEKLLSAESS